MLGTVDDIRTTDYCWLKRLRLTIVWERCHGCQDPMFCEKVSAAVLIETTLMIHAFNNLETDEETVGTKK